MTVKNAASSLRKCVKARYGNWMLVHLPSGRWACIWGQVLAVEDMCVAVLDGTWFHDENPDAATQAEALQLVVQGIERELLNVRDSADNLAYKEILHRARSALGLALATKLM